ncbi:hypothetical protein TSUD_294910 [Trifolium subterraneum]|uniref:Uncharacterized protein n=1 Tax=Trifolium subterraneum TaxID=3900 RepID=A0A2Z6MA56_TRISU|nr:hypothetical protein TSUD_294910 [Trifolium subterraneum]
MLSLASSSDGSRLDVLFDRGVWLHPPSSESCGGESHPPQFTFKLTMFTNKSLVEVIGGGIFVASRDAFHNLMRFLPLVLLVLFMHDGVARFLRRIGGVQR